MRKLWKKSPVLLTLVIALSITTVALGAYLWQAMVQGQISSLAMPNVSMMARNCTIEAGSGTVDVCTASGGNIQWEVSGADDDTIFLLDQQTQNLDTAKTFHFTPTAELSVSAQACEIGSYGSGVPCEGHVADVDDYVRFYISIEFGNLAPSDTVNITDMALSAEDN